MGRPRSFDSEKVIHQMMRVFWEKGYEGATLEDLEQATGLKRVSLYNAFGDKRELFLISLRHYRETITSRACQLLGQGEGLRPLRRFFEAILGMTTTGMPSGCMMVNCAVDANPPDDNVFRQLEQHFASMQESVARTLEQARANGELAADFPVQEMAVYLNTLTQGMAVMARQPNGPDRIATTVRMILRQLDSWSAQVRKVS